MRIFDCKTDELNALFEYNAEETIALKDVFSRIRTDKHLSIDDLRRVALWKIDRVLDIPDDIVADLDALAKRADVSTFSESTKTLIARLIACDGVGFPMASAILKFLRPDIFPIIDIRAYRAVFGKKLYPSQYTIALYLEYVHVIYNLSAELKMPLAAVDEQLYLFDKKYNGKI